MGHEKFVDMHLAYIAVKNTLHAIHWDVIWFLP